MPEARRRARVSPAFVWLASVRDLRWRWRRFLIAAFAAALVLGLTVLLSGLIEHLDAEVERTVDAMGVDTFVIADGIPGPFTSVAPVPASIGAQLEDQGVRADPIVTLPQTIERDTPVDAYVIGFVPGARGKPPVAEGRSARRDGEAVVDRQAGVDLGEHVVVGGARVEVVGLTDGLTVLGERPNIYLPLESARRAFFEGQDVATAFLLDRPPRSVPDGVQVIDREQAIADLRRPMADTVDSITLFRLMLWLVAAAIVGSVLYLSALERSRDFAVMKATGTGSTDLVLGLILQAVVLAVVASIVAIGFAEILAPLFPAGISMPLSLLLTVPVVALVVGVLGSLVGLRRVLKIDPALAFGGP